MTDNITKLTTGQCIEIGINTISSCATMVCTSTNTVLKDGEFSVVYSSLGFSFYEESERLYELFKTSLVSELLTHMVPKENPMPLELPESVKALIINCEKKLIEDKVIKGVKDTSQITGYWQTKDRVYYLVIWLTTVPDYGAYVTAIPVVAA
jgi:hypothetical protein